MQNVTVSINEIIGRIKSVTDAKNDADIARLLHVAPNKLAVWKLRNTIPYEEVIAFCKERELELEWVLTGEQKTKVAGEDLTIRAGYVSGVSEPLVFFEEPEAHIHPQVAEKIIHEIFKSMTAEEIKDVIRYAEERRLLAEIKAERSGKKPRHKK